MDEKKLHQIMEQIERMYRVLSELKKEKMHPQQLAVMREGPLAQIEQLKSQICEELGIEIPEENLPAGMTRVFRVICANCFIPNISYSDDTPESFLQDLNSDGWSEGSGGNWYCPVCKE